MIITLTFAAVLFATHQLVTSETPAGRVLASVLLLLSTAGMVGVLT